MIGRVPRKAALPLREVEICRRLEAFRRGTRIPRSVFARTVGFGPERLATYEGARSPIRYEAFRAISDHFFLNPQWLATGQGSRVLEGPFDDGAFRAKIEGRALLSEVYDRVLKGHFDALEEAVVENWLAPEGLLGKLGDFDDALEDPVSREKLPTYLLERMDEVLDGIRQSIRTALLARGHIEKGVTQTVAVPSRKKPPS